MANGKKRIPSFANEEKEREFWSTADSTEYVNWNPQTRAKPTPVRPLLKTISLRLPAAMIADLKLLANSRDVPYQSLLKMFLAERLARERRARVAN